MEDDFISCMNSSEWKEGMIVELSSDSSKDIHKALMGKAFDKAFELKQEKPNVPKAEIMAVMKKEFQTQELRLDDIQDNVRKKKYGLVEKKEMKNGRFTLIIRELKASEYRVMIPIIAKYVAKQIKEGDVQKLIEDALMESDPNKVKRIHDQLEQKKPTKVKSRRGCFAIEVGNESIDIR